MCGLCRPGPYLPPGPSEGYKDPVLGEEEGVAGSDMVTGTRIETGDVVPGVRLIAFNRPEVRNAFDTAMYLEVTAALRAADADEAVGAVVLTGPGRRLHLGRRTWPKWPPSPPGTEVEGAGQGFMGLLDCIRDISVPLLAAVNGVAVGLGLHPAGPLRPRAGRRGRTPARALRRARRAARGGQQLPVPRRHGLAAGRPGPPHLGLGQRRRAGRRSAWPCRSCAPGTVLDETVALAARIAAHPRSATRAITSLMRAARRDAVREANRREQARVRRAALRARRRHGTPGRVRRQADA